MEPTYPILPYCLYHGSPLLPCVSNGEYELSCVRCTHDMVMQDAEDRTIRIPLTEEQYKAYDEIAERMNCEHLPNMGI